MSRRRYFAWDEVGREVQLAQWREALEHASGNITHASKAMGFSRRQGTRLTGDHGLADYAAELRERAVGNSFGRPRGTTLKRGRK